MLEAFLELIAAETSVEVAKKLPICILSEI